MTGKLLILATGLLAATASWGLTITVDGLAGDWGATAPLTTDPDEAFQLAPYDISDIFATMDATDFFFRMDTYGTPTLEGEQGQMVFFAVCLDTDQNSATGYNPGWDPGTTFGGEVLITYMPSHGMTGVYDCSSGSLVPVGIGGFGIGETVELSAPLAWLNLTGNVDLMAFLDNASTPEDDFTSVVTFEIPEPTTMLLLGVGAVFASVLRRKS